MKTVFATSLVMAVIGISQSANAETIRYTSKGNQASAYFFNNDGCAETSTNVWASESTYSQTGSPTNAYSYVEVSYSGYNWCTGESLYGYGSGAAQIQASKSATTVTGSVLAYDYYSGAEIPVDVNLTFTANNEYSSNGVSNYVSTSGPIRTRTRSVGSNHSATATGSVMVAGVNVAAGQSSWADISNSKTSERTITKPNR